MLDVVANFARLSDDNLFTQLKHIVRMADEGVREGGVERIGLLTAADRDRWAKNRMKLIEGTPQPPIRLPVGGGSQTLTLGCPRVTLNFFLGGELQQEDHSASNYKLYGKR